MFRNTSDFTEIINTEVVRPV